MKAIVTGASGFVGRHLRTHLRACRDEVIGLDMIASEDVEAVNILDADSVRARFETAAGPAPTNDVVVYHLAAISHVGASWDNPADTWQVNAIGTVNVLAAAHAIGAHRVIVVASSEVYGTVLPEQCPVDETCDMRPTSPYGASKAAADIAALQAWLGSGLPTIRVRAFNHTGPGQSTAFLLPALAQRIAAAERAGERSIPIGNLDAVRDISDVRDVVHGYRLLAEKGQPGEAYHICSGVGHTVRELAEMLLAASTTVRELVTDPALVRPVEIPVLVGSHSKISAEVGWSPEIPLAQTLAELLEAARSH